MSLELSEDTGSISVSQNEQLLTRYNAAAEGSKPGFDTVALPSTTDIKPGENLISSAPHDHPWHLGVFFCPKLVDGINCWESELYEMQGRQHGYAEHDDYDISHRAETVEIAQRVSWKTSQDENLLGDQRTVGIHVPTEEGYFLTWEQEVTALNETRHLSSETLHGHYSGLSIRFARSLADGRVLLPDDTDVGTTSPPRDVSGPTGKWCDYSGALDGKLSAGDPWTAGITMFDHPKNDAHPVNWFIMTEPFGFLAANPTWKSVLTLGAGESHSWTWGMWVHPETPTESRAEDAYRQFLTLTDK